MARDFQNNNNQRVGSQVSAPITYPWTVAAICQPDTIPSGAYSSTLVSKVTNPGSTSMFNLEAYAANWSQYVTARACAVPVLGAPAVAFLVAIFNGASSRLYRDAALVSTGGNPGTVADAAAVFQMGGRADFSSPLDGRLCEVAMWNASLSTLEIAAYCRGVSPLVIRPLALKAYWPIWGHGFPEPDLSREKNHLVNYGGTVPPASRHLGGSPMAL